MGIDLKKHFTVPCGWLQFTRS